VSAGFVFLFKMASPVVASSEVLSLLKDLHTQSAAQETSFQAKLWYISRALRYNIFGTVWTPSDDKYALDQFVALEPEKCDFVYLLARSIGALNIVEAGTSFGVSTIYLALAVGHNVAEKKKVNASVSGKVIATEKESSKAARAREHWSKAGTEVEPWIELREGDLLETLKVEEGMPEAIDMLLLDSVLPS
jgi:predicted O-methyltransferase YrrM